MKIIKEVFDVDVVKIVSGDDKVSSKLLENKFDHIFFTGSAKVGRIVMQAASKHLTPVTLELGGIILQLLFIKRILNWQLSVLHLVNY